MNTDLAMNGGHVQQRLFFVVQHFAQRNGSCVCTCEDRV